VKIWRLKKKKKKKTKKKGNASSKIDGKLISKLGYLKSNEEINSMSDTKDNIKKN